MTLPEIELGKLLEPKKLEKLLKLEKERRGKPNRLVFIGMADLAGYYWCAMKSLLSNKEMELAYFASYLEDRLGYAKELGYIKELPTEKGKELLEIGNEITLSDVNKLLEKRAKKWSEGETVFPMMPSTDKKGNKVAVINQLLSPELRQAYVDRAKAEKMKIAKTGEYPAIEGRLMHSSKEKPSIRWNFNWENFVVGGAPDGMTDEFVYEFKTTRSRFFLYYVKPTAFPQADLYGYFFQRPKKRVEIFVKEEKKIETFEEKIDKENAVKTLQSFKEVCEGGKIIPPKKWKCKRCEYKEECKLSDRNPANYSIPQNLL